jgi:hypothetical protein
MNLKEMADTIDAGVEQAQQHLQEHLEEARANLNTDTRSERAQRRASRERSQGDSVLSEDLETNTTKRVAAWASSLDDSHLDEIPEEDSSLREETPDDATHKDTDPSSFPSGVFDHSYNYERGLRRPNITIKPKEDSPIRQAWTWMKSLMDECREKLSHLSADIWSWTREMSAACRRSIHNLPSSPLIAWLVSLLFGLTLASTAGFIFCYTYTNHVCDPLTTSAIGMTLQKYCGTCIRSPAATVNFTNAEGQDLSKIASAITNINHQIRLLESRINDKLDSCNAAVNQDLESLRRQQHDLSNSISGLSSSKSSSSSSYDVASPVIAKVNYFAPNNGAVIDPRLTSPTLEKPVNYAKRVFLRMVGSTMYHGRPPITALQPWQDVGECWCAAARPNTQNQNQNQNQNQDSMRLAITTNEMIYPTELLIENYPSGGSLFPGSTPKKLELWADFAHLDGVEWEELGIPTLQGDSPLGATYAMVGSAKYDTSSDVPHVQAFRLDINIDQSSGRGLNGPKHFARHFVLRVVENYGARYTCLYRVRLHGVTMEEVS